MRILILLFAVSAAPILEARARGGSFGGSRSFRSAPSRSYSAPVKPRRSSTSGLVTGLVIGAAVGHATTAQADDSDPQVPCAFGYEREGNRCEID